MENKPNFNTDDNNIRFIIESSLAKLEKANIRLWIVVILLIVALLGTNIGWLVWESQWQYVQTETSIDAMQDGDGNVISGGDLYYGTESEDNEYDKD